MKSVRYLCLGVVLCSPVFGQLVTKDMSEVTPVEVGQLLAGPGIMISNVKLTGAGKAAGSFTGGLSEGLGIEAGIILSTGEIKDAAGPNQSQNTSGSLGSAGDADLDKIVAPNKTKDATVLEFDFATESPNFNIKYVFASEEYKEFVGSQFNDVFGFFLNAQNIALIPGTGSPVAINSVNHIQNTSFFRDNPPITGQFKTEFDGFTAVLTAQAVVNPGQTYHIKLAIADTSDAILDSAVFLAQGGITGAAPTNLFLEPREVTLSNSQSITSNLSAFSLPIDGSTLTLSARGLPEDSTVTFSPAEIRQGSTTSTVTVTIGPNTLPNTYIVVIRAGNEKGLEVFTTMIVNVDCAPPFIFGLPDNQPNSQNVAAGQRATLKVVPQGSGSFTFQWFQGPRGSTFFPVDGATRAEFTTPPIVSTTSFWVRVSNPCGSVDSEAAQVSPR